jgi:hypothetical protein
MTENHDLAGFTKKQSDDFLEENIHIGNNIEDALGGVRINLQRE